MNYDGETDSFSVNSQIEQHPDFAWANYVRGVLDSLQYNGLVFSGADLAILGNIPQGAGLSSSASLEVAVGQAFNALYDLALSQQDLALIGQQAENEFVGCQCGIMDQLIVAKGQAGHALLIDCRSLETSTVAVPAGVNIMIVNSNIQRRLLDGEYNARRQQCEAASLSLGARALRDVSLSQFNEKLTTLNPVVARRAKHVISENDRTEFAYQALANNDIPTMGKLMRESHASMRDDFEITVEPIDYLFDLVNELVGEHGGARMTGGGFGGCVVALLPEHLLEEVSAEILARYKSPNGTAASIYCCQAADGACLV
jgi:galactokinase